MCIACAAWTRGCQNLGDLKPKCTADVRVQPKARTDVSQKKERGEMTGHERKEEKKKCVKGKKDEKENQMKGTGTDETKPLITKT